MDRSVSPTRFGGRRTSTSEAHCSIHRGSMSQSVHDQQSTAEMRRDEMRPYRTVPRATISIDSTHSMRGRLYMYRRRSLVHCAIDQLFADSVLSSRSISHTRLHSTPLDSTRRLDSTPLDSFVDSSRLVSRSFLLSHLLSSVRLGVSSPSAHLSHSSAALRHTRCRANSSHPLLFDRIKSSPRLDLRSHTPGPLHSPALLLISICRAYTSMRQVQRDLVDRVFARSRKSNSQQPV